MKLYYKVDADRSFRVRWLLRELGLSAEEVALDMAAREPDGEAYRKIHPQGKVPALVLDDGEALRESCAICLTLLERLAPDSPLLVREAEPERARFLELCFFGATTLEEARLWVHTAGMAGAGPDSPLGERAQQQAQGAVEAFATFIEGPFLFGERFTVADIICGYALNLLSRAPFAVEDEARAWSWLQRLGQRWTGLGLTLAHKRED